MTDRPGPAPDLISDLHLGGLGAGQPFGTVLADPPWRFSNRTGKVAPEHRRLARYSTLMAKEIAALPVAQLMAPRRSVTSVTSVRGRA